MSVRLSQRPHPLVVVFVVSGFPLHHFGARHTPRLWNLAGNGSYRPGGGLAVLAASTCPNMVSLVTGTGPARHGIYADSVIVKGESTPAWAIGTALPTLFDAGWQAGQRMAVVFGEGHLVRLLGVGRAAAHWPESGRFTSTTRVDSEGRALDTEVAARLAHAVEADVDLVVGQFAGVATASETEGPDSDDALDAIAAVDEEIGRLVGRLERRWNEVVLLVLSDHGEEEVIASEPFDLAKAVSVARLPAAVVHNGAIAFVSGEATCVDDWLRRRPELMGCRQHGPGLRSVWLAPGSWFGSQHEHRRGMHGGLSAASQLAIVSGGHPAARRIGEELALRRPGMADWGATIAELVGVHLTGATGSSMMVPIMC